VITLRTIRRTLRAAMIYVIGDPGRRRAARDRLAIAQLGDSMIEVVNARADIIKAFNEEAERAWYQPPLDPRAHERRDTRGRGVVGARVAVAAALLIDEDTGIVALGAGWGQR
jgi:hypothetical protein